MKIKLCHHLWQDKANATWFPKQFPYPEIEQEIKTEYPILQAERPKFKRFGELTVFFDYRPSKDLYGREIVPISFAFLPDCGDASACAKYILPTLSHSTSTVSDIEVDIPQKYLHSSKAGVNKTLRKGALAICIIASLLGVLIWSRDNNSPTNRNTNIHSPAKSSSAQENTSGKIHQSNSSPAPEMTLAHSEDTDRIKDIPAKSRIDQLCSNQQIKTSLFKCPKAFFDQKCTGNISKSIRFSEWMKSQPELCNEYARNAQSKIYIRGDQSRHQAELDAFFR